MAEPAALGVTVLVVEDEEDVRDLARDLLEMNGYTVLEASNAEDAIRLGESHARTIDLVITDVVMPRMSGPELIRRLRARRPGLRVLCMSGYPEQPEPERVWTAWLQKPFTPDVFMDKVRECLTS